MEFSGVLSKGLIFWGSGREAAFYFHIQVGENHVDTVKGFFYLMPNRNAVVANTLTFFDGSVSNKS